MFSLLDLFSAMALHSVSSANTGEYIVIITDKSIGRNCENNTQIVINHSFSWGYKDLLIMDT